MLRLRGMCYACVGLATTEWRADGTTPRRPTGVDCGRHAHRLPPGGADTHLGPVPGTSCVMRYGSFGQFTSVRYCRRRCPHSSIAWRNLCSYNSAARRAGSFTRSSVCAVWISNRKGDWDNVCPLRSLICCSDVNKDWTCKDKDNDFTYSYLLQVAVKPTIAIKQQ